MNKLDFCFKLRTLLNKRFKEFDMNKILVSLLCAFCLLLAACKKSPEEKELDGSRIYFFYQTTCPHCHDAAKYIKEKHPDLKIVSRDVRLPGNQKLFRYAVKKYKIGEAAGTPLICFKDKYIMGWSDAKAQEFEKYAEPYQKQ